MSKNSSREIELLKQSFELSDDLPAMIESLKRVYRDKSPIALYIATLDKSDIMWLFDKKEIFYLLGGESQYISVKEQIFPEKQTGIMFFILKKAGPFYSVVIDFDTLEEIIIYLSQK